MAKKPKTETRRSVSPIGVASFPNLFTAKKINESDPKEEPKFRVTLVVKPGKFDEANKAAFNKLIQDVNEVCIAELVETFDEEKQEAFMAALEEHKETPLKAHFAAFKCLSWYDKKDQVDKSCRSPFLLGKNDDYVDDDGVFMRLSSKADRAPEVIDQSREALEEKDIYGGALIRVSITSYPYNNLGNRGVTMYMGNVQKVGKGTRFGGGPSAKDEFDEVPVDDVAF